MNHPFTVEEINFMCVFGTSDRMKMMEEIRRVMLHIKDSDMAKQIESLKGIHYVKILARE